MVSGLRSNCSVVFVMTLLLAGLLAATVSSGGNVTLSWTTYNATYNIVSPGAGAVRGTSVVVNPTATTTYTLYSTNQFGRTTSTVPVNRAVVLHLSSLASTVREREHCAIRAAVPR